VSPALRSQLLGVSLAVATAVGCIAYERLVKAFQFSMILTLASLFYVPALTAMVVLNRRAVAGDLRRMVTDPPLFTAAIVYYLTWITVPLWYVITRKQTVMAGALYEIKYVVVLGVFYLFAGAQKFSLNLLAACVCATLSVWFISRT
jgi:hypothetical protein